MTYQLNNPNVCVPWRLNFDRDGTEDVAVISDSEGYDLVTSNTFRRPEADEPVPEMLASLWLMTSAPQLFHALQAVVRVTLERRLRSGVTLTTDEQAAHTLARLALAQGVGGGDDNRVPIITDLFVALVERRQIADIWDVEDVQSIRPDLSDDQAWDVLQTVARYRDAGVGINWHVLECQAETLFGPEPETPSDAEVEHG